MSADAGRLKAGMNIVGVDVVVVVVIAGVVVDSGHLNAGMKIVGVVVDVVVVVVLLVFIVGAGRLKAGMTICLNPVIFVVVVVDIFVSVVDVVGVDVVRLEIGVAREHSTGFGSQQNRSPHRRGQDESA